MLGDAAIFLGNLFWLGHSLRSSCTIDTGIEEGDRPGGILGVSLDESKDGTGPDLHDDLGVVGEEGEGRRGHGSEDTGEDKVLAHFDLLVLCLGFWVEDQRCS